MTAASYRLARLARLAARHGMTLAQLANLRETHARAKRRAQELRWDRRSGWVEIARKAAANGRGWAVVQ